MGMCQKYFETQRSRENWDVFSSKVWYLAFFYTHENWIFQSISVGIKVEEEEGGEEEVVGEVDEEEIVKIKIKVVLKIAELALWDQRAILIEFFVSHRIPCAHQVRLPGSEGLMQSLQVSYALLLAS